MSTFPVICWCVWPKSIPTRGLNIVQYFDWLPSNNQWQSFVCGSYLLHKIYKYINIINDFLSSSNTFNFYTAKNYLNLTRGQNIIWYFDPSSNNQWQSFICLSYLLEKMYYYIKIILMISWVFMMLLFCTTNTWFHKVINGFISCKLKQDTSQPLILFW